MDGPRVVRAGTERAQYETQCATQKIAPQRFCNNAVTTSKYTVNPFSPHFVVWKNVFEQLHRVANCYFLFVACIQAIPGVSPTGRFTTIVPLAFVMFVSMLKDAFEDYKRHRLDQELNASLCCAFRGGEWVQITWRSVVVGDILRVEKGESFPADLVLVATTEPEGLCYIETASLDGETNLKIRKSSAATAKSLSPDALAKFGASIECEPPNNRLYKFDGNIAFEGSRTPLSSDNVLLRGAVLRNTETAYGIVVYTGRESKLMMNASQKRHKMSNLDRVTNRQVLYIFVFQLLLVLAATIGLAVVTVDLRTHWYVPSTESLGSVTATGILTFLVLFNNLIPISLYVSMEMVKLVQAYFISSDAAMYYPATDTSALARTSALNEELGQVGYIFSDKTGTLTCNRMDFIKFTCPSVDATRMLSFGCGVTEVARAAAARTGLALHDPRPQGFKGKEGFCFYDLSVATASGEPCWQKHKDAARIAEFLRHLALCHTVVADYDEGSDVAAYQAASPDEGCLVRAARELGVAFHSRTESTVTISYLGVLETYDILQIVEFDSTRKRMSVIVRDATGTIQVLCKGADSVIYERLLATPATDALHAENLEKLTQFAAEGLRTLVIAKATLTEPQYTEWAARYEEACCAVTDRDAKVAAIGEEIERDLVLLGATAIEDKLQDAVPQTIELMLASGIRVWVLTGDKQETAINIGYACSLLHNEMTTWTFEGDDVAAELDSSLREAQQTLRQAPRPDMALIVQGGALETFLADQGLSLKFLELAKLCKSVICCRVSPLQKAQIVMLVRENVTGSITLAVGDGANDVSMIQSADVGVGIAGVEGLQAARASDYSIAQFHHLRRLLLVHGRWNYRRVARLIKYSFYKNICLYLTQFWFCCINGFSGQSLYDQWSLAVYNVWFTAFPVMVLAVLDRDVEPKRLLSVQQFPDLYADGIANRLFNARVFWRYVATGIFHSVIAFWFPIYILGAAVDPHSGSSFGIDGTGVLIYSIILGIVSTKIGLETLSWTWVHVWFLLGSLAMWFFFLFIYGSLFSVAHFSGAAMWYYVPQMVMSSGPFWLILFVVTNAAVLRDWVWKVYLRSFAPQLSHVIQAMDGASALSDFSRRDVVRTHADLLATLQTLEPKRAPASRHRPSMAMRTGFAFAQEGGQRDITRTLSSFRSDNEYHKQI